MKYHRKKINIIEIFCFFNGERKDYVSRILNIIEIQNMCNSQMSRSDLIAKQIPAQMYY